jgi:hypothetical protein
MGKDVEFLLTLLADGEEHELGEILQRSIDERGHGLTVHSRAADLRKLGYKVKNRQRRLPSGRTNSYYQLLGIKDSYEQAGGDAVLVAGVSSSLTSSALPTKRVEAATTPEVRGGWDEPRHPEADAATASRPPLSAEADAIAEGVRAETRRKQDGTEGDPGSALTAGSREAPPGGPPEVGEQQSLLDSIKARWPELFEEAA